MDNQLVLQKTSNQLEIKNLEKLKENIVITLGNAIDNFTISHREDLIAIFTVDQTWHFYRITTAKEIADASRVPYKYFDIVFIFQNSLWTAVLRSGAQLEFTIFSIFDRGNEQSHSLDLNITDLKSSQWKLFKHFLNNDALFCVLRNERDKFWLVQLKFEAEKFEVVALNELKDISVCLIQPSFDNSFVAVLTSNNEISLLNTKVSTGEDFPMLTWRPSVKQNEKIRSICFDPNFVKVVCIESNLFLHFLYFITENTSFISLVKIPAMSEEKVIVAIRMPTIYSLDNSSKLLGENFSQLQSLKVHQDALENALSLEYSEFVKKIHQIEAGSDKKELWLLLAKRSLQHEDIETALFCAARMNDACLIRELRTRQQSKEYSSELLLTFLYLNFNFLDEAEERLLAQIQANNCCQSKELLGKLYSLQNRWEELFRIADPMQLKTLYYSYARKLEEDGEIDEAIKYFELSGNQLEVPRMLFESGNIVMLEEYCLKQRDTGQQLVTWWGQYCESQGDNHRALEAYRQVNDHYNMVRLLCQDQRVQEAIMFVEERLTSPPSLTTETADRPDGYFGNGHDSLENFSTDEKKNGKPDREKLVPAILYLGKHLESSDPLESIRYYLYCKAVRHAIRVCIIRRFYDQLAAIAVEHCSEHEAENILQTHVLPNRFELESDDSLIPLLYKCGRKDEAFHSGIVARAWAELRALCDNELSEADTSRRVRLDNDVVDAIEHALREDTSLIDIFIDVVILSDPDNFSRILTTVQQYGLVLDDHLMDKLERVMASQNTHTTLVETFAELCLEKGNYQLAAKLFNKSGKRVDAMKALIRSGNAEKVIQFANIARDKQIFKMAGNFLQTVDHDDHQLIEKFYLKASAQEELDRFRAEIAQN